MIFSAYYVVVHLSTLSNVYPWSLLLTTLPSLAWLTAHDILLKQDRSILHDLHQKHVHIFLHIANLPPLVIHLTLQHHHHLYQVL